MFNLPNLSSKALLLSGASLAAILITAPAQATTLGGMTGRNSAQVNMTNPPPRPAGFGGAVTPDQAKQNTAQSSADFSSALARIQGQLSAQASARSVAAAGPNNLGADPNHPGQQLPDVPNGLGAGGLAPSANVTVDPSLWQNADAPTQAAANGQTTVTIHQNAQKAILTWDSFNVGKNTTVHFDQTKGTAADGSNNWIALNRIVDPSDRPSQILGNITAEGSVYLINRNGVIFGGSSQVNTHSLIASSLAFMGDPLNLNTLTPGSTGYDSAVAASNTAFLTQGILGVGNNTPILGSNQNSQALTDIQGIGAVSVEAGAQIQVGSLGYALLAAPDVSNAGTILAPDGQVILAAGIGIALNQPGTPTSSWLFPYLVGQQNPNGNLDTAPLFTATNSGLIQATTGDVTLVGAAVSQQGVIEVTTGISRPGAITLTALDENLNAAIALGRAGPLVFGSSSVTTILPEEDGETTTSTQAANASFVPGKATFLGGSITFQNGSLVEAPGANVAVTAAVARQSPLDKSVAGRIYMDTGSTIDVAGLTDVELPIADTLLTIGPLTANDLADTPLDRDGPLIGQSVTIDSTVSGTRSDGLAWVGSPILDAQGHVDSMPRTIDQMLVAGGAIDLTGGEVITTAGSTLNVMGGYVHYLGGVIKTTRLIDAAGQIVDISQANPEIPIVGLAGQTTLVHGRWGITDEYTNSLIAGGYYQPDYVQGGDAGTLDISVGGTIEPWNPGGATGAMILNGAILAGAQAGLHQVAGGNLPDGGSLIIGNNLPVLGNIQSAAQGLVINDQGLLLSDLASDFNANTSLKTPDALTASVTDPGNILYTSTLSATLIDAAGFSSINLNAGTALDVEAPLAVQPGGSIKLTGGAIRVNADLTAPGGTIALVGTGYDIFQSTNGHSGTYLGVPGDITIEADTIVSAAGRWVNDTGLGEDQQTGPADIDGGSISLSTRGSSAQASTDANSPTLDLTGSIFLDPGSVLDVSSGGYVGFDGTLKASDGVATGKGGSISLETYVVPTAGASFGNGGGPILPTATPDGGNIVLDGTLRGYGFSGGGTLTLQALDIQIGGDPATAPADALLLAPDFFTQGGFGAYDLTAVYDATVAAGATVTVSERNFVPNLAALLQAPTGTNLYGAGRALPDGTLVSVGALDPYHRQGAGFSLTAGSFWNWNASGTLSYLPPSFAGITGTLLIDQGASILADPGADVSLTSYNQLTDLGLVVAHGGDISLTATPERGSPATGSVWLGADSVLDASGVALLDPLATPIRTQSGVAVPRTGTVLAGGSVTVLDGTGTVVAEAGSLIDISGTATTFDIPQDVQGVGGPTTTPTLVWSDAGVVTLGGAMGLLFDGALAAHGGAPQADGGTLVITAAEMSGGGNLQNHANGIILQQSGDLVPVGLQPGQPISAGTTGIERFAVDRLDGSGIESLLVGYDPTSATGDQPSLPIGFAGNVSIDLGRSVILGANQFVALPIGATSFPTLREGQSSVGGTAVSISAPYVAIGGNALGTPVLATADATLSVSAGTLDFAGAISLENFGAATFASTGDIRLYAPTLATTIAPGELVSAGDLTFQAAQIYPATATTFIIDAIGPMVGGARLPTSITILSGGASSTPLSAGGSLLLDAPNIVQGGTLRAPDGTLILGVSDPAGQAAAFNNLPLVATASVDLAAGSITSVSIPDGMTVPYGTTIDGTDWQYQIYNPNTSNQTFADLTAPPVKLISINGNAVALNPGATVDLAGGGAIEASEWVAGTGGSRNLLLQSNTSYASGATPTQVPQYPDNRAIYAVIPGFKGPIAPVDPEMAPSGAAVGQQVYLSGAPGLAPGIYTLLPAQYANVPGAFRVVQQTGVINALAGNNAVQPDGGAFSAGYFVDGLTSGHSAQTTSFLVQSASAWGQYSQFTLTNADAYFTNLATSNGASIPRLLADGGQLALTAVNALTLGATLDATPGSGGRGAQVDISSKDIQIIGDGEAARSGYLQLNADDLSALGAESLLIGGTRTQAADGDDVTVSANSIVVSTNAAHPLTGPEVILVTQAGSTTDPNAATGLLVESGSVIAAKGDVAGASVPLNFGRAADATNNIAAINGDGALLAVSNGGILAIARNGLPTTTQGLLNIQASVTLDGGKGLTLDSSGATLVDPSAVLSGTAIAADSNLITFVDGNSAPNGSGLAIGAATLAQFAKAQDIILRSYGAIDFEGNVTVDVASDLTLSAGAFTSGAQGDAGSVAIHAGVLTLTNDLNGAAPVTAGTGMGALALSGNEIDFGVAGSTVQSTANFIGFGSITAAAINGIVGQGSATFDFGNSPVTLTAPIIVAGAGGGAILKTTGVLDLDTAPAGSGTSADAAFGGAMTLIGGAIQDNTLLEAPAGNISLEATSGDLTIASGAVVDVAGVTKQFFDQTAYAPAGAIVLTADVGAIHVAPGAVLNFAGVGDANGGGNAGSLTLSAPRQTVDLQGTLQGGAGAGDGALGGSFTLDTGGGVNLDSLAAVLASSGVNHAISIHTRTGNLILSAGNTITATGVALVADGGVGGAADTADGNVIINGTIDANGLAGGQINLFGKSNVDVEGSLLAVGTDPTQHGGAVQIGTTAVFNSATGGYDPIYGYESIDPTTSGAIRIGANAVIDVSGGGARGGTINLRAPLLSTGDVNVTIDAAPSQIRGAHSVTLEAYAVWNTTDATVGAQHFDGIIDPAGWYDANGALMTGTFTGQDGTASHYDGTNLTAAELTADLANDYFTPDAANAFHETFYGYVGGDATAAAPGTLMGFIQNGLGSSFGGRFAGIANFQAAPGVELDNTSASVNGGDISVLTNWNLGAGALNASGAYVPVYRYLGTVAPFLTLRAQNSFQLNASITDGFKIGEEVLPTTPSAPAGATFAQADDAYTAALADPSFPGSQISFDLGQTVAFSSVDPNYAISGPLTNQSGAYYSNYLGYVTAYQSWLDQYIWQNTVSFGSNFLDASFLSPPPSPTNFSVYANYVTAYQAWVTGAYAGAPNILTAANYNGYLSDYGTWLNTTFTPSFLDSHTAPAMSAPTDPSNYTSYTNAYFNTYLVYLNGTFNSSGNNSYAYAPVVPESILPGSAAAGGSLTGNLPSNMPTAATPLALQFATLMGGESASYRIVAGADFSGADPLAVQAAAPASGGNVSLDGHFSWIDSTSQQVISAPTTLRTGTGSIDIAAAGDIEWQDPVAPAAVYTGGEPAPGTTIATILTIDRPRVGILQGEYVSTGEVHPQNAGDISITAGRDITGIEQVYDTSGQVTGTPGAFDGQTWWQWMETANPADGSASSINFAAFDQGVMSAGGDVRVAAGRDIRELSVSLPTTWFVTGDTVTTVGGGDLSVTAGRDILSGSYFVAKGTGTITAGGAIGSDFTVTGDYQGRSVSTPVSTLLGYQDTVLSVSARQDADIGGVYDPSYLQNPLTWLDGSRDSQSPTARSSLSILSVNGEVRLDTMTAPTVVLRGQPSDGAVLPASLSLTAFGGGIDIGGPGSLYPSPTGQLTLLADQSISFANNIVGTNEGMKYFGLIDADPASLPSPLAPISFLSGGANDPFLRLLGLATFDGGGPAPVLIHDQDPEPVRVYALDGDIFDGVSGPGGFANDELVLTPNKPAFVQAGRDIVNLSFLGENLYSSDVTRIIAGHDIYDQPLGFGPSGNGSYKLTSVLELAGPGYFDIEAGRNIGPLTSANASYLVFQGSAAGTGLGAQITTGIQTIGDALNPALPKESASISILFGIAPGMDDAGFEAAYLAPGASIPGVTSLTPDVVAYVQQVQQDALARNGQTGTAAPLTTDQAWTAFLALPQYQQQALIDKAFFNVLSQVGADYNAVESPFFHQYSRGYQAINTLFPASMGYTQNSLDGGTNGANQLVSTGTFDMRGATVQTQEGGDVNILGPGGRILVGSASAPPFVVDTQGQTVVGPNQQGILTLETGDVNIFSDQSLLLAQSRIFTEQGGDMVIWSSNGDINAGEGVKTSSDVPPPFYRATTDGFFTVDAKSQVTGAGIATLQTKPDSKPGDVFLIAPRGTVDAGAAGIRVSGDLFVAALAVANANNIQVQGKSVGLPPQPVTNLTLTTASTAATEATQLTNAMKAQQPQTVLTVEVTGFGGQSSQPDECIATSQQACAR